MAFPHIRRSKAAAATMPTPTSGVMTLSGLDGPETTDLGVPNAASLTAAAVWRTQPSVRKVIDFAARAVSSLPWKAYIRESDNDRTRLADSHAETLMRQPDPFQTSSEFIYRLVVDRLMYDRWLALYLRDRDQLVRIPPRLFVAVDDYGLDRPNRLQVNLSGRLTVIDNPAQVPFALHTGWNEFDANGIPSLTTLADTLTETLRSRAWRNAQWERSPKITGYLTRPATNQAWNPQQREKFIQSWRDFRDGKAGTTPLLEDGMEYKSIGSTITPRDAQEMETRQLSDIEVCSFFHIAPELVGARQGTFATVAAYRQMLFGPLGVGPLITELEQAFNAHIIGALEARPGAYLDLDRQAAVDGSFLEQASILQTSVGGPIMTRNEGRAKIDLPAIPGGDDIITPLNVTAGGQASPTDSGSQNEKPDAPDRPPRPSDGKAGWWISGEPS